MTMDSSQAKTVSDSIGTDCERSVLPFDRWPTLWKSPSLSHQIGETFLGLYYQVLELKPEALHRFYNEHSTMSVSIADATGATRIERAVGTEVNAWVPDLAFLNRMGRHPTDVLACVQIGSIVQPLLRGISATNHFFEAHPSSSSGVILHASGSMKKDVSWRLTRVAIFPFAADLT